MKKLNMSLYHHGIKGQKWGKRNGPPYPLGYTELVKAGYLNKRQKEDIKKITDKNGDYVVKKGTEFSRITTNKNETSGSKYMSFLDEDKNTYRSNFIHYLNDEHGYEDTYKADKDVKIASHERTISTILEKIGDKKVQDVINENDLTWENTTDSGYLAREAFNKVKNKTLKEFYSEVKMPNSPGKDLIAEKEQRDLANNYVRIGSRVLNKTLYNNPKIRDSTIAELKKQGYDAMVDIEDAFSYSTLPVITFTDKIKKTGQKQLW